MDSYSKALFDHCWVTLKPLHIFINKIFIKCLKYIHSQSKLHTTNHECLYWHEQLQAPEVALSSNISLIFFPSKILSSISLKQTSNVLSLNQFVWTLTFYFKMSCFFAWSSLIAATQTKGVIALEIEKLTVLLSVSVWAFRHVEYSDVYWYQLEPFAM